MLEPNYVEILEICEEIEEEEHLEDLGPQIELDLSNPTDIGEPLVEDAGVAPAVVVEVEEESSVEVLEARASAEEEMGDQAIRTGVEPVLESVEREMEEQDVRTRDKPVHEAVEERTGVEPVLKVVEMGTGDIPIHDVGEGDSHFEDYPG